MSPEEALELLQETIGEQREAVIAAAHWRRLLLTARRQQRTRYLRWIERRLERSQRTAQELDHLVKAYWLAANDAIVKEGKALDSEVGT